MPHSGYPFAAKVGQFKPPNWASSEYRNQLGDVDIVHALYGIIEHYNAMSGSLDKMKRQEKA